MKSVKVFFLIIIVVPFFVSSCIFRPIGKCTYGDNKPAEGTVTIAGIEKKQYGRDMLYLVHVKGFFSRTFRMTPERYRLQVAEPGHAVGSELKGFVLSGGPCPPQFRVDWRKK